MRLLMTSLGADDRVGIDGQLRSYVRRAILQVSTFVFIFYF